MRSSKSRSRNKPNRNRSVGNVVNRVFDSNGPEGKVRGTPQQIIDKYNQLARDAQLSGDRVALENFQQHSEHYTRMLAEAQREQEAKREKHEAQQRERQQQQQQQNDNRSDGRGFRNDRNDRGGDAQPQDAAQSEPEEAKTAEPAAKPDSDAPKAKDEKPRTPAKPRSRRPAAPKPDAPSDVIDLAGDDGSDSGLVETPESKPAKPRARRPRKAQADKPGEDDAPKDAPGVGEAAE